MGTPDFNMSLVRHEMTSLFINSDPTYDQAPIKENQVSTTYARVGGFCGMCTKESRSEIMLEKDTLTPGESMKLTVSSDYWNTAPI